MTRAAMAWWLYTTLRHQRDDVAPRRATLRAGPDPSAVLHVGVYDAGRGLSSRASLVAQWLTTAKMLILDPTNIYCDPASLVISRGITGDGLPRSFDLEADVRLRDRRFAGCVGPFDEREATASLRVSYCRDPEGVTAEQLLALRPSTALEQLRQNSEETGRKLGNQSNVERMLRDFPLLFDVRDVELTSLNMYLKDLFTGYRGAKERSQQKTASKLEKKGWTASEEKHPVTKRARGVLRRLHFVAGTRI